MMKKMGPKVQWDYGQILFRQSDAATLRHQINKLTKLTPEVKNTQTDDIAVCVVNEVHM